jgi:hypothetical protein
MRPLSAFIVDYLPHLHGVPDHAGILYLSVAAARRAQHLGLHYGGLSGLNFLFRADRHHYRKPGWSVPEISGLDWMISIIGVGIFAVSRPTILSGSRGCTTATTTPLVGCKAVMGALLYLNFINRS